MNIFYIETDPQICAIAHVDKHVVKMILEYAQLLSTAHHLANSPYINDVYKPTHKNHPSNKWTRNSTENYNWLFSLWENLLSEYSYRYSKSHASSRLLSYLAYNPVHTSMSFSEPWLAMPDEYKISTSNLESYRNYYRLGKTHLHKWSKRNPPAWIV